MARRYNAFYDEHADHVAWKAHELWMAGETAQDVARALEITVPQVYKAVALVARLLPRPGKEGGGRAMAAQPLLGGKMTHIGDVTTWDTGCSDQEQARKVWEEAQEVWAAMYWGEGDDRVKAECADVIQATCNLLAMLGVEDFEPYMAECLEVQKGRGRL